MNYLRKKSLENLFDKQPQTFQNDQKYSSLFATNVFTNEVLEQYVNKDAFNQIVLSVNKGSKINRSYADQIAASLKAWALSKGATHYTHWFQPLTGGTAEKHDAFFDIKFSRSIKLKVSSSWIKS